MKLFDDITPLKKLEHIEQCIPGAVEICHSMCIANAEITDFWDYWVPFMLKRMRKLEAVAEACKGYQLERIDIAMASSYWEKSPAERSMDDALIALEAGE